MNMRVFDREVLEFLIAVQPIGSKEAVGGQTDFAEGNWEQVQANVVSFACALLESNCLDGGDEEVIIEMAGLDTSQKDNPVSFNHEDLGRFLDAMGYRLLEENELLDLLCWKACWNVKRLYNSDYAFLDDPQYAFSIWNSVPDSLKAGGVYTFHQAMLRAFPKAQDGGQQAFEALHCQTDMIYDRYAALHEESAVRKVLDDSNVYWLEEVSHHSWNQTPATRYRAIMRFLGAVEQVARQDPFSFLPLIKPLRLSANG